MKVDLFDFHLSESLIATQPLAKRDGARMLVVDERGGLQDSTILQLPDWLKPGDVLVLNDTKVMPARLFGKRGDVNVELLLHQQVDNTIWKVFAKPAKRLKVGDVVELDGGLSVQLLDKLEDGQLLLDTQLTFAELINYLEQYGHVPLPPYIQKYRADEPEDKTRYQTVFSDDTKQHSVVAPTAGLHFTESLLEQLKVNGVHIAYVTLHVGAGTFLPVKAEDTKDHIMHSEYWEVSQANADIINQARDAGGRVVAVGTTSLRTLESAVMGNEVKAGSGDTTLFITPGYQFKLVDVLLTNFHLPKSTLFMLVSAFSGAKTMKRAYQHAICERYRFYSYGDACLLHRAAV